MERRKLFANANNVLYNDKKKITSDRIIDRKELEKALQNRLACETTYELNKNFDLCFFEQCTNILKSV